MEKPQPVFSMLKSDFVTLPTFPQSRHTPVTNFWVPLSPRTRRGHLHLLDCVAIKSLEIPFSVASLMKLCSGDASRRPEDTIQDLSCTSRRRWGLSPPTPRASTLTGIEF